MSAAAAIVVWRRTEIGIEWLVLHRSHFDSEVPVDWAWGPPGGGCVERETPLECAQRELREETGIDAECIATECGGEQFVTFHCEVPADAEVVLSREHDAYRWLPLGEARELCRPQVVGDQLACVAALLGEQ